jgi:hypothetical protein
MPIQPNDPWQDAANQASGMEGLLVKHNCKTGLVTVDGTEVGPDFRMVFLMETAMHGWLLFEDNQLVDKDPRRFAHEAPDPKEQRPGWEPNTSVLGVSVLSAGGAGRLLTYCGASWSVRRAFMTQLLPPYQRLRRQAFPIVALGFGATKDSYGNFRPVFDVVDWRPRSDFAAILGVEPVAALEAPGERAPAMVTPPRPTLANVKEPALMIDGPPPIESNDYEPIDEIQL